MKIRRLAIWTAAALLAGLVSFSIWRFVSILSARKLDVGGLAELGDNETLTWALRWNKDGLHSEDSHGWLPLHRAVASDQLATTATLLRAGADPNCAAAKRCGAFRPLHCVKSEAVAQLLLRSGADVNGKDIHGCTPLHDARDPRIAKLLVESGADIEARDDGGQCPIHKAAWVGSAAVVRELLELGAHVDSVSNEDHSATCLHIASRLGYLNVVEALLHYGASIDSLDKDRNTALMKATPYPKVVEALLSAGADVNLADTNGKTALHSACAVGNPQVVKLLIDHDANVTGDGIGNPVWTACYYGKLEVLRVLLKHGGRPQPDCVFAAETACEQGRTSKAELGRIKLALGEELNNGSD